MARTGGFGNINLDLMFGLPGQTRDQAVSEAATVAGLGVPHLSFYQLTLEPNTLFHKYPPPLPKEDETWAIQQDCQRIFRDQGYGQYEVSAYARDGWRCRHNLNYWGFGDYLGIGAGAHGKLTDPVTGVVTRTARLKHPQHYLDAIDCGERPVQRVAVPDSSLGFEFLMNALRLREGFPVALLQARTGWTPDRLGPAFSDCLADGLLEQAGDKIRCTQQGFDFLDDVLQRFLD